MRKLSKKYYYPLREESKVLEALAWGSLLLWFIKDWLKLEAYGDYFLMGFLIFYLIGKVISIRRPVSFIDGVKSVLRKLLGYFIVVLIILWIIGELVETPSWISTVKLNFLRGAVATVILLLVLRPIRIHKHRRRRWNLESFKKEFKELSGLNLVDEKELKVDCEEGEGILLYNGDKTVVLGNGRLRIEIGLDGKKVVRVVEGEWGVKPLRLEEAKQLKKKVSSAPNLKNGRETLEQLLKAPQFKELIPHLRVVDMPFLKVEETEEYCLVDMPFLHVYEDKITGEEIAEVGPLKVVSSEGRSPERGKYGWWIISQEDPEEFRLEARGDGLTVKTGEAEYRLSEDRTAIKRGKLKVVITPRYGALKVGKTYLTANDEGEVKAEIGEYRVKSKKVNSDFIVTIRKGEKQASIQSKELNERLHSLTIKAIEKASLIAQEEEKNINALLEILEMIKEEVEKALEK